MSSARQVCVERVSVVTLSYLQIYLRNSKKKIAGKSQVVIIYYISVSKMYKQQYKNEQGLLEAI